jgi:transposase
LCELETLKTAYQLVQQFFLMVRERKPEQLDRWLEACCMSSIPDLQTFAEGLKRDYSAMKGALIYPYSNGPVEGQVTKIKYIKRSMYGRENFTLLRQRILHAA